MEAAEAEEVEGSKGTHQLINRVRQSEEVLLDCEVENVSVFDVDGYCHDPFSLPLVATISVPEIGSTHFPAQCQLAQ